MNAEFWKDLAMILAIIEVARIGLCFWAWMEKRYHFSDSDMGGDPYDD